MKLYLQPFAPLRMKHVRKINVNGSSHVKNQFALIIE